MARKPKDEHEPKRPKEPRTSPSKTEVATDTTDAQSLVPQAPPMVIRGLFTVPSDDKSDGYKLVLAMTPETGAAIMEVSSNLYATPAREITKQTAILGVVAVAAIAATAYNPSLGWPLAITVLSVGVSVGIASAAQSVLASLKQRLLRGVVAATGDPANKDREGS